MKKEKHKTHVVGLQYYSLSGLVNALDTPQAQQLKGKHVYLTLDEQCVQDRDAVMTWSETSPIGHISRMEVEPYVKALTSGTCEIIEAVITGIDTTRNALLIEPIEPLPEVESTQNCAPIPSTWNYNGPLMTTPQNLFVADHLMRMMERMASGKLMWGDTAKEIINKFIQFTLHDLSGEAYWRRIRLAEVLQANPNSEIAKTGVQLLQLIDHMGGEELIERWYMQTLPQLINGSEACHMAHCYTEYTTEQLLPYLRTFPKEIGRHWLSGNFRIFTSCLYYAQLPRTMHIELYSLITLYLSALCREKGTSQPSPLMQVSLGGTPQMDVGTLHNYGNLIATEKPLGITLK